MEAKAAAGKGPSLRHTRQHRGHAWGLITQMALLLPNHVCQGTQKYMPSQRQCQLGDTPLQGTWVFEAGFLLIQDFTFSLSLYSFLISLFLDLSFFSPSLLSALCVMHEGAASPLCFSHNYSPNPHGK